MTTQNFSKQIPKNLFVNILSFLSTVLIGLWLTPYLLEHLGIVAYGLIPLAMFLSQYVSVIINAINMSINRFLLIALQKKQDQDANEIFNTALVILFIFIFIQALVMGSMLWDITQFFTIPTELIVDATWLFGLTFVGFSISLFRSVFGTSMFAYNRLDILRMIDIVQNVVRVVSIVALFLYDEPSLKYIGMANLLAAMSAVLPTLYYFRQYTPQLKVNVGFFSKHRTAELSKMSTWVLINQVGVLLLGNIDLYLVNVWLGTQATGEYAIVLQFTSIFKTFLTLLAGILTPVIMIYYAKGDFEKLKQFTIISSKIMVAGLTLPLALLIGFSEEILRFWLGNKYVYMHTLISFALLFFVFAIPVIPLFNVTVAYNKVKLPALLAVGFGIFNIMAIYFFTTRTDLGLWGVVSVKLLLEILFSSFILLYVSKILDMRWISLCYVYLYAVISFLFIYFIIKLIKNMIFIETFIQLSLVSAMMMFIFPPIMLTVLFSKEEKMMLTNKYPILKRVLIW